MAKKNIPEIILPHGGCRKMEAFRKSEVIYEGTILFCKRFLPAFGDRTVDQMVQAARSCKQNILEGSDASGTSKETEIKLTNVARASLQELIEDYNDWLISHHAEKWAPASLCARKARTFAIEHSDWQTWEKIFTTRPADTCANLMLTICHQTHRLLGGMVQAQKRDFLQYGGVRERMHAARTAARGEQWEREIYSRLTAATSKAELQTLAATLHRQIDTTVLGILRRKGW